MDRRITNIRIIAAIIVLLVCDLCFGDEDPTWTVPRLVEPTITPDAGQLVEGTSVAPPLSWHARINMGAKQGLGPDDRVSQLTGAISLGLGLPWRFEGALLFPFGVTFGTSTKINTGTDEPILLGLGEEGAAIGDLTGALLFSAYDATNGGLGLLFGVKGTAPTGNHERLMGEGGFAVEPFATAAFQILGSRLSFNLGYRIRPQHVSYVRGNRFEQDDDLIWRVGIRVPRKFDIAWSIEAEGTIGMATDEGIWPSQDSRPVFIGAGLDFPVARRYRFGGFGGFGITGEAAPAFAIGFNFSWMPVPPDEDEDGVGAGDDCPLLQEDHDGFEDSDGCPDLDNDSDGFPDDEDQCPLKPGGRFSEDGC